MSLITTVVLNMRIVIILIFEIIKIKVVQMKKIFNLFFMVFFGIASTLSVHAKPKEYTFLSPPDPNAISLMVLQKKAKEFFGHDVKINIQTAPGGDVAAMKAIMTKRSVDYALFNVMGGGFFYSKGLTHLKLGGVQIWGGVAILTKKEIKPKDWKALKGKKGLSVPAVNTPPYMLSLMAMKKNGVSKKDVQIAGTGPGVAFKQMSRKSSAPDFVVMPEPLISIALFKQQKEKWEQHYHLFADSVREVSSSGVPLGSFWIVKGSKDTPAVIDAFAKAVDYTNNPKNRKEVIKIASEGFSKTFKLKVPEKVFADMFSRDLYKAKFKEGRSVEKQIRKMWKNRNINPDSGIFYSK